MKYDFKTMSDPETGSSQKNSKSVPNMNFTPREILNKFTTGQPISGMAQYNDFDGQYDSMGKEPIDFDSFQPHPKTLDLVDRQNLAEKNRQELQNIDKRQKDRQQKDADDKKAQDDKLKKIAEFESKNNQADPTSNDKK